MHNRKRTRMKPWKDLTHYAGFDWAKDHHAVVIVDREGRIVADFEFEHIAGRLEELCREDLRLAQPGGGH